MHRTSAARGGVGIIDIEFYTPSAFVQQEELERHDNCIGKYTEGLGQQQMSLCDGREDGQSLALTAVNRLLCRTCIDRRRIGRIDVGTETLVDTSKSTKTTLMSLFDACGNATIEGATHLNACYGGTAAFFAAVAWVESSAWDGRLAIVVSADIARYARGVARCTSGAGAVAMLIGPNASLVLDGIRSTVSEDVHDFYKPMDDLFPHFPRVDGALSKACYMRAFSRCHDSMTQKDTAFRLEDHTAVVCHAPYSKLVRSTLGRHAHLADSALRLTARCGNMYTASLYAGLLSALNEDDGEHLAPGSKILCFAYGAGFIASMFVLHVVVPFRSSAAQVRAMLDARVRIGVEEMHSIMDSPNCTTDSFVIPEDAFTVSVDEQYRRSYATGTNTHVQLQEPAIRSVLQNRQQYSVSQSEIPLYGVDYSKVIGRCAERVVGHVPVPLGMAGPVLINGGERMLPMATTEGCLIASTSRGCKAISLSGGADAHVLRNHMTRGPVMKCVSMLQAVALKEWIELEETLLELGSCVETTSRYAKLVAVKPILAGSLCFLRLSFSCGNAMGMNMSTKATDAILSRILVQFEGVRCISISGNVCCDKKAAAINWLDGRGCHVLAEVRLPSSITSSVFKCTPEQMLEVHISKNLVGSAMAGAIGGSNAHAANVVAAIFLACGQDAAQIGTSSMCMTHLHREGSDLVASCTMPCVEVGTIGGGTHLDAQRECLRVSGSTTPPELAQLICCGVLAAELSLIAALATGSLLDAHMKMNR